MNGTMIPEGELVKTSKREKARAKMVQMLQDGDLPGKDVYAALAAIGVGSRTVEKVKKELHVRAYRSGNCWYWNLPRIRKDEDGDE